MFSKEEDKMINLGLNAISEEFDEGVSQALDFLTEIGTGYLNERKEPEAEKMVISIKEIGKAAALQGMENAAVNAIRALEKILQCSMEQNTQGTTVRVLLSFGAIGKTAAEQQLEMVAKLAASVLGKSGNTAALLKQGKRNHCSCNRAWRNRKSSCKDEISRYFGKYCNMYLLSWGYGKTYGSEESRKGCSGSGTDARRDGCSSHAGKPSKLSKKYRDLY